MFRFLSSIRFDIDCLEDTRFLRTFLAFIFLHFIFFLRRQLFYFRVFLLLSVYHFLFPVDRNFQFLYHYSLTSSFYL